MSKKAVVLFSGGLDSATAAFVAKDRGYEPHCLYVKYQDNPELTAARAFIEETGFDFEVMPLDIQELGVPTPDDAGSEEYDDVENTYVPFRNAILLSIGTAYAMVIDAERVFVGFEHEPEYPDTSIDFVRRFNGLINEGTPVDVRIEVKAPFANRDKVTVIETAERLDVPMQYTWSCYADGDEPCGKCPSCEERVEAFEKAGVEDPVFNNDDEEEEEETESPVETYQEEAEE